MAKDLATLSTNVLQQSNTESIVKSVKEKSGKGDTYFGATGCGKTYTMAFFARQLSLRCAEVPEIGSPTIVMIVDREELQKQGAKLFTKSKEFLNLGDVSVILSRINLREGWSVWLLIYTTIMSLPVMRIRKERRRQ